MIPARNEKRHKNENERTHHEVDARAEHVIDLAHVVGGACHRVADGLQVVEGHAFGEQGKIQFIAYLQFHLLREQFRAKVASQLQDAAYDL